MQALKLVPTVLYYDSVKEWAEADPITERDLLVTNEWLWGPYIEPLGVKPAVIFQEKYGMGEPSDDMIDAIVREAKQYDFDRVIAFGGGTILDICKVLALEVPERVEDLFMGKVPPKKIKTLVAVPTTCGTGSEVTNVAITELKSLGIKKGIAVPETFADTAVLIPETMKGLPYKVFVTSSVDALIHAIESFLSPKASPFTEVFSREATRLIMFGYKEMAERGEDARFDYMKEFLIAANYAGIAFGNAGVGLVHALAYSIGGAYHVPHGEANYQFFAATMKLYAKKAPDGKIRQLTELLADILGMDPAGSDAVYEAFDAFLGKLIAKKPLREYGMTEAQIDEFTVSTVENQQRLLVNNYVFIEGAEIRGIFEELY